MVAAVEWEQMEIPVVLVEERGAMQAQALDLRLVFPDREEEVEDIRDQEIKELVVAVQGNIQIHHQKEEMVFITT